jgi:hypothetical protein
MLLCQRTHGCTHVGILTDNGKCSLKSGEISQDLAIPLKNHVAGIIVVNPLITNLYYTNDKRVPSKTKKPNKQASYLSSCNNKAIPYYFNVYSDVNYSEIGISAGYSFETKLQKCVFKCDVNSNCYYLTYTRKTGKCDLWETLSNNTFIAPNNGTVVAMYASRDRLTTTTAITYTADMIPSTTIIITSSKTAISTTLSITFNLDTTDIIDLTSPINTLISTKTEGILLATMPITTTIILVSTTNLIATVSSKTLIQTTTIISTTFTTDQTTTDHRASYFPCCSNIAAPNYFNVKPDVNFLKVGVSAGSSQENKFQKCISKCDVSSKCYYLTYNCETRKCDLWETLSNSNVLLTNYGTIIAMYDSRDKFSSVTLPTTKTSKQQPLIINGCFSLNNLVKMSDFSEKPIKNLRIGDIVSTIIDDYGNIGQTEVITIMEFKNTLNIFLEIKTESGHSVILTANHLIFEKNKGYIRAEYINLNDEFQVSNGTLLSFSKVTSINQLVENGFIAPLTESGSLIVNGIHASCFAGVSSHSLAKLFTKPLVYFYNLKKYFQKLEKPNYLELPQQENFIHPYIAFLKSSGIKNLVDIVYKTVFQI